MTANRFDPQALIDHHQPESVLLVAPETHPWQQMLAGFPGLITRDAEDLLKDAGSIERVDLALVAGTLETLPRQSSEMLIALLRDRLADTFYCLANPCIISPRDMIALGLVPQSGWPDGEDTQALYYFSIHDYKRTPDWLNPRFWAHPELWDRYRW